MKVTRIVRNAHKNIGKIFFPCSVYPSPFLKYLVLVIEFGFVVKPFHATPSQGASFQLTQHALQRLLGVLLFSCGSIKIRIHPLARLDEAKYSTIDEKGNAIARTRRDFARK
jgi:hypothetical protein